jgi:hypothetical protein
LWGIKYRQHNGKDIIRKAVKSNHPPGEPH